MINGKQAWALLAAGILTYEFTCDPGELMSEQCDRWIEARPLSTRLLIAATGSLLTLHLGNFLPPRFDVISQEFWKRLNARR